MLHFEKHRSKPSLTKLAQMLADSSAQSFTEEFPRLGDRPILRESNFVEELFRFDGPPDATVSVGGTDYYYFCGEGYLSLQTNPEVMAATCEAVLQYGTSLATLRRRYTPAPVVETQLQAAEIYRTQSALYTATESCAVELVLEAIADSYEVVFIDALCSESMTAAVKRIFGPRGVVPNVFPHRDVDALRKQLHLTLSPMARPLLITEGVFNINGTIPPLPDYYALLAEYPDAGIFLDDSEGLGILGGRGCGVLEYFDFDTSTINRTRQDGPGDPTFGIEFPWGGESPLSSPAGPPSFDPFDPFEEESPETDSAQGGEGDFLFLEPEKVAPQPIKSLPVTTWLVASLGRAIGGIGGIIPGSSLFVERLRDIARPMQNGLLPPPAMAAASRKGLQLSFHQEMIRHKLWNNVYYFKSELEKIGLSPEANMVPIVAIAAGSDKNMRRIQRELIDDQILTSFVQQMSPNHRHATLRIALFANHQREMIDHLLDAIKRAL